MFLILKYTWGSSINIEIINYNVRYDILFVKTINNILLSIPLDDVEEWKIQNDRG